MADEPAHPGPMDEEEHRLEAGATPEPAALPAAGATSETGPTQPTDEHRPPESTATPSPPPNANLLDQAELDALAAQLESESSTPAGGDQTVGPEELAAGTAHLSAAPPDTSALTAADAEQPAVTDATAPVGDLDDPIAQAMAEAIATESGSGAAEQLEHTSQPDTEPQEPAVIGAVTAGATASDALAYSAPELDDSAAPAEAAGTQTDVVATSIELLDDVQLEVKIELGRASMYIEDVLKLGVGSVVELDKLAGDPVDIYVNERLIARGEVLVLNENFCVRINDIRSPVPELEAAQ